MSTKFVAALTLCSGASSERRLSDPTVSTLRVRVNLPSPPNLGGSWQRLGRLDSANGLVLSNNQGKSNV